MAVFVPSGSETRGLKQLAICLFAGSFLFAPAALPPQEHSCLQRPFLVSAVDKEGKALAGLTPENFKGKFRGKPVRVVSVRDRSVIPRIVILLDSSGSMIGASKTKWELASHVAAYPGRAFRQETEIALIVFSDRIRHEVGFGRPRQAIQGAIAALRGQDAKSVSGRTALFAAILRATELLQPGRPGDVIYVVSDGGENASKADYREVEQAVLNSGARVFTTMLVDRYTRTPEEAQGPADMANLARASGGYTTRILSEGPTRVPYYNFTGTRGSEIARSLDWLNRRMWELTEIEIELPREVDKPRTWKLELVSTPGVSAKGATLTYPTKLVPCAP